MNLSDIQKSFIEEIQYIDDTAQIILKGHLVAEDLMNQAIDSFVFHGEYIKSARLQFRQKLYICKAISLSEDKNNMWNVLEDINKVRNAMSHSLDKKVRQKAFASLKAIYMQEFKRVHKDMEGISEEAAVCLFAMSGALGFLHSFLAEIKRFEELIKCLDKSINIKK